ncbi:hypothetical protein KDN24_16230 [Bacillus sp. Bva_UNVM-123]
MKMFASDLDRTLIFSRRALAEFGQAEECELLCVERKDDQDVAFMKKKAFKLLKEIAANLLFVPVTTRTYEQFNRIFPLSEDIVLPYAVTSNGANIIHDGKPLIEWNDFVQKQLRDDCACLVEMVKNLEELKLNGTLKIAEDLFFYYILNEPITIPVINRIKAIAIHNGWRVSIQGRKLYVMPKPISKGAAIRYIKEKHGIKTVYGAGDSILDYDFLQLCDVAYIPIHGELVKENILNAPFIVTEQKGVKAGEEVLRNIANTLKLAASIC